MWLRAQFMVMESKDKRSGSICIICSAPLWLCVSLLFLAGCATKPLATATITAPITGTLNIGHGAPELVPVVKTITLACEPPSQFLSDYPPLPILEGERMSEKQMLAQWASDMAAYADLRADHNALADWVREKCTPK